MNEKKKWIEERLEAGPFFNPLWDRAIRNVRAAQERELERFRETIEQDDLECIEFRRLVEKEAARRFGGKTKKRTRQKTARGKKCGQPKT